MANYRTAKLGEFLTHRSEFFEIDDTKEYKRVRVQLHGKGIVLRDIVTGLSLRTKKQQGVRAGEFLVAEIDAKVGGFGVVPSEFAGAIVSSHYFLFAIDESKCLHQWLEYYVRSGALTDQVTSRGSTNYAAIRAHHVLNFEIPLPPLAEQQRVVARIDALAGKIAAARGLRGEAVGKAKGLWAKIAQSVMTNSSDTALVPLSDLVAISGGNTPDKGIPEYWNGKIPWVSPKDMKSLRIGNSIDHITDTAVREGRATVHPIGAVLLVVRGMILAHTVPSAVLDVPAAINQDMKALIPKSNIKSDYLSYALWADNHKLLKLVERSTHGTCKLQTEPLLDFGIPVPSQSEQRKIVDLLDHLRLQTNSLERYQSASNEELDALLPAVLDRAFKGDL